MRIISVKSRNLPNLVSVWKSLEIKNTNKQTKQNKNSLEAKETLGLLSITQYLAMFIPRSQIRKWHKHWEVPPSKIKGTKYSNWRHSTRELASTPQKCQGYERHGHWETVTISRRLTRQDNWMQYGILGWTLEQKADITWKLVCDVAKGIISSLISQVWVSH